MKSFTLICLLGMVFGVIIDNCVLAKQICRCLSNYHVSSINNVERESTRACGNACWPRFYCYDYLFELYCEVTDKHTAELSRCCQDYSPEIIGISCQRIAD